jgi:hypothetical protein
LIGGPNQSHKVNFKEPPRWGKISSKNFCVSSVNTYSKISEKILAEEQLLAVLDSSHHPVLAGSPRIEGRAEHARLRRLFKTFLSVKIWNSLINYMPVDYISVFSREKCQKTGRESAVPDPNVGMRVGRPAVVS